jgi:sugar lactone lactonase YvrE
MIDRILRSGAFALVALTLVIATSGQAKAGFANDVLATDLNTGNVFAFDPTTGASLGSFATMANPRGIAIGPDGNVYVNSSLTNNVAEYNGTTGALINASFVPAGDHGLGLAYGMAFGPNGNLYVSSFSTNSVLEYNGTTGAFVQSISTSTFPGSADAMTGPAGLAFGPDGNLYVAGSTTGAANGEVIKFDLTSNTSSVFGPPILEPSGVAFGAGHLFVAAGSPGSSAIGVLDATTGAFQSSINDPNVNTPGGLAFINGFLYVASYGTSSLARFTLSGDNLVYDSSFNQAGMTGPIYLAAPVPEPSSVALLGLGSLGLAGVALRRKGRVAD